MKKYSYILLFSLGFILLAALVVTRYKRDRDKFQEQIVQQQEAVMHGWEKQWAKHLLELAQAGELPITYSLEFSRSGRELKSAFFPDHAATSKWQEYRAAPSAEHAKSFLQTAIRKKDSWDRVLAISEWTRRFGLIDELRVQLTPYEMTLVDDEAKAAYQLIFNQFSKDKDFTLAQKTYQYDDVFYRVMDNGNIHAFVPSARQLQHSALAEFLAIENIPPSSLGSSPWIIRFGSTPRDGRHVYADDEWLMVLASVIFITFGIFSLVSVTHKERRILSRKVGFLNQVVHELKTPLTGLRLHTELLTKHGWRPESAAAIEKSVGKLDRLFNEITILNREGAGNEKKEITSGELHDIINALLQEFPQCRCDSFKISSPVRGSIASIEIILRNLISNGISYGESVQLTFEEGADLQIFVQDNGPGIKNSELRKIFSEFYRSEAARDLRPGGLGLGLSVAQKLAKAIGAEIRLVNPGEKGAKFALKLERVG